MQHVTLLPLLTSLLAAAAGGAVLARGPNERINQITAGMLLCGAWWALTEVVWNNVVDPVWVMRTIRLSSFGWVPLGALALHLVLEAQDDMQSLLRRALPFAYGLAGLQIALYLTSDAGLTSASPTAWGWVYTFGPAFPWVVTPTLVFVALALARWRAGLAHAQTPLERRQAVQVLGYMLATAILALVTDILLPQLGIPFPQMGSISVILFSGFLAYGVTRHDYFVVAPGLLAQRILESLNEGAALLSEDNHVQAANDAFARLTRTPSHEVVGERMERFLPGLAELAEEAQEVLETDLEAADDTRTPVAVSSSVLHDKAGRRVGRVISVRDLSDVANMRDRVVTAGRLAAVGELAASVVHEISNPIAWMRSNLTALRELWEDASKRLADAPEAESLGPVLVEGGELIDESIEGVERIARLVASVRSFSHAGQGDREHADVNVLLAAALAMAEPKLRAREAAVEFERGELPLLACATQDLKQLFLNLLINAANAVESGGRIRVQTGVEEDSVFILVEDAGCGMSLQQVRGLFDPVFRAQGPDGGFAIGLPACYEIVRKHGGELQVDSEIGRGTRFRIVLRATSG